MLTTATTITLRVHALRHNSRTSTVRLRPGQRRSLDWVTDHGWYDLEVTGPDFRRRLTGRVENGRPASRPDLSVHRSTVAAMDMKTINPRVIEQFRAGGEIEGMHRERLLLLTTTGARTGQQRTTPMMFHMDGDRPLVMASNAGDRRPPDWYANLLANPSVRVEIGDESYEATATVLSGDERERLWAEITAANPFFLDHEKKAERQIPVVALTRT